MPQKETITHTIQSPNAIVMVRPHHFRPNDMSASDNGFQKAVSPDQYEQISLKAYDEISKAAKTLEGLGIKVHIFEDKSHDTPDSIFPNNWFTAHPDGNIVIYPLYIPNRRKERRHDIIHMLQNHYNVKGVYDYSNLEEEGLYLEGTGAMVIDYKNRIAYAARSNRAHESLLQKFCDKFSYKPFMFDAQDHNGVAVYHTNVMMCIAEHYALIGLDMVPNIKERTKLHQSLEDSGKTVINLSEEQIFHFSGNAIELSSHNGPILIMSQTSRKALTNEQIKQIEQYAEIIDIDVQTAEMAGGSIRCMIAAIHLDPLVQ